MGERTKISWADHTGNPWVGCTVAHAGCLNCYARDCSQKKHGKVRGPWALWGPGQDRRVTKGFWTDVLRWAKVARKEGVRRTLFASLMDPLDPEVYERETSPAGVACRKTFDRYMEVLDLAAVVAGGPGLVPLLLTKRPQFWHRIPEHIRSRCWLIYSASDQPSLDAGVGDLLAAEGFAGLGLSLEPLVGPVKLRDEWLISCRDCGNRGSTALGLGELCQRACKGAEGGHVAWVIIGGESGRNARPCDVAWLRAIVRQCREAGVSPYVKQMGAFPHSGDAGAGWAYDAFTGLDRHWRWDDQRADGLHVYAQRSAAGSRLSEWPEDLRFQEFPEGLR